MLHAGAVRLPSSRALFHVALAGIFLPCLTAPVVGFLAILAGARRQPSPDDRVWARALAALAVVDILLGVGLLWLSQHPEARPRDAARARGLLGVWFDAESGDLAVRGVRPGSPAERAGVVPGDEIVALDDAPVATRADLQAELARREVGVERRLAVLRAGERRELRIVPQRPPPQPLFEPVPLSAPSRFWPYVAALVLSLAIVATCFRARPGSPRLRLWVAFALVLAVSMGTAALLGYVVRRAVGGWSIGGFLAAIAAQAVAMLALSAGAMKWMRVEPSADAPPRSALGTSVLGGWYAVTGSLRVSSALVLIDALVLKGAVPFSNPIEQLAALNIGAAGWALLCVEVVVLGPVAEEFLFRGFLLPRLVPQVGAARAVAAGSLLFALLHPHYGLYVGVPLFLGLVLSWARLRSTLVAPVALHVFVNGYVMGMMLLLSSRS